jgi:hypothetical protein
VKIDAVYLLAHRYYMRLTRICVASIRYWYPEVPIYLIKDEVAGPFSTEEIERYWNVGVMATTDRAFGWGFGHLEPLLDARRHRFLVMDVDIAFVGRVIDRLEQHDEDFVIDEEDHPDPPGPGFAGLYFNLERLKAWDPAFTFPRFAFNAGQFVGTAGVLTRADFDGLVRWSTPRATERPEIFNYGDQGLLNYVLMKKLAAGAISVARVPFMRWGEEEMREFELARIDTDSPYPFLIHWAGLRKPRMKDMCRADILYKFEDFYYSRIPLSTLRRPLRLGRDRLMNVINRIHGRLRQRTVPRHQT